ncbi:MAG TPA: FAD-dependent oxidoreductase [Gaiellales bacterium]
MAERVVVVGLGVVGLSTALALAGRGHDVIGIDRFGSGHPHTSSTGASRSIRVAYALPDYARLAAEALDRWALLEARAGDRLVHLTGQLDIGAPETLAALTAGLRAAGAAFAELTAADIRRRMPQVVVGADACGLFHDRAGTVLADRAMAALHAAALAAGADLRAPERAAAVSVTAHGVRVCTDAGTIDADRAVIAAGPWTPELVGPLGMHLPLAPAWGQVTYFEAPAFVDVPGIVEWGAGGAGGVYGHAVPGIGYKLGFDAAGDDPWQADADPAPDDDERRRLEEWAAMHIPDLAGRAIRTDRHPWTMTPDGDFAIGAVGPVTIAAGCSGHAFKFGPALGELVADTSDGRPRPAAAMFALDRPGLRGPAPAPSMPISR